MLRTLAVVLFVGIPSIARADAVPPPPTDCPPGAVGETGHNGPWCLPTDCAADADCARYGAKHVCQVQGLCVEVRQERSRSGWSHGHPVTLEIGHATCVAGDACKLGQCVEAKRCVVAGTAPAPKPVTKAPEPTPAPITTEGSAPAKKGCAGGPESIWVLALPELLLRRRRVQRHLSGW